MKKILLIILIAISLVPTYSRAQTTEAYTLLEPLPCIEFEGSTCKPGEMQSKISINGYIMYIYKFSIAIAVFLAIVMIIWGGFNYITSEVPFIKSDGRSKITNALSGLAMVLVSYLILATIDPRLVNIDSNIPPLPYTDEQLKDVNAFQKGIEQDLNRINDENKLELQRLAKATEDATREKAAINAKINSKELSGEEAQKALLEADKKITDSLVQSNALIAESEGLQSFTNALYFINDPEKPEGELDRYLADTVPNPRGNTPRRVDSENIIQNQYNQKINEILNTNSSYDVVQKLEKQRDFYIAEVKEEKLLKTDLSVSLTYNLTKRNAVYVDNIKNAIKNSSDAGISLEQYVKIMQARIDKIDATLKPKK